IYELKHRPESKLLQMLADDLDSAARAGLIVCPRLRALADAFWPGALTVVADASDGSTIGLRIPDHPLLHALLPLLDGPLAATSANRSGDAAATTAESAVLGLEGLPDLLVDGGPVVGTGQPSTVVSICGGDLVVLRPGPIGETALRQAMG
ncbi:MAG: Sua5/YciO/YrdC/YwlC family protein, partial [Lentisphaeria bacterium]|nr:Sua5/YciO/YrdC/YwlC family protein [Lentisphaeria bacterium]